MDKLEQLNQFVGEKHVLDENFLNKKGLCGLTNLGNTCYMNAILQCLNNTMPLLEYFISNTYKKDVNLDKIEKYIVEHWNVVSRSLWFSNNIVSPQQLHSSISMVVLKRGLNQFQNYSQNDSQEFLQFFLESLHTALSKEVVMKINGSATNKLDNYALIALESWSKFFSKEYSKIIELFYGQFFTTITTIDIGKEPILSESFEPFSSLSLEIPKKLDVSLYDCLDNFTNTEILSSTDVSEKSKRIMFWSLPTVLVIFFKRWDNRRNKINTNIDFPLLNLDMSKYMQGYNKSSYKYNLYAVVNHSGGSGGGHYYSYNKNNDGNWYKYNDTIVSTTNTSRLVSSDAYCLFYNKV